MAPIASRSADAGGRLAPLDDVDRAIIDALRRDGRMSMRALSARLHVSRANVYTRVERLERHGVITGYTATVDPRKCGQALSAYVYLKISQQAWKAIRREILDLPEVAHAALVAGDHDIVLLTRAIDAEALRDLVLTRLQAMKGVQATRTELIFEELHAAGERV